MLKRDPEQAHELSLKCLKLINSTCFRSLARQNPPSHPVECMGLTFKNPVGLAAGFDKTGDYVTALGLLGFGFIEIGTVTPVPQAGNAKPRLFRLKSIKGIINRMGFNNPGIDQLVENIKHAKFNGILGVNIGKNRETPLERSSDDYVICMEKVYAYTDYIAVNISSPNTPGLRDLQYGEALDHLLNTLKIKQQALQKQHDKYVPIAVKISPDLSEEELIQLADSLVRYNIDAVIATNTTLDHSSVRGLEHAEEIGGLSGKPIQLRSTKILTSLSRELQGKLPIIGVGGIDSLSTARKKIAAGATLIQLYSGLVYQGPALIKHILTGLSHPIYKGRLIE